MKEDKEFDKYVKGLFKEDPLVPVELKWDAMEFDLPSPKAKEKKKKRRFFFIILLLLAWVGGIFTYKYLMDSNSIDTATITQNQDKNNQEQQLSMITDTKKKNTEETKLTEETITPIISQKKSIQKSNVIFNKNNKNTFAENAVNESISLIDNLDIGEKVDRAMSSSELDFRDQIKSVPVKQNVEIEKLPFLKIDKVLSSLIEETEDTIRVETFFEPSVESNDKTKLSMKDVFVGFGFNSFGLNHVQPNLLTSKVYDDLGKSFTLGTRINFKKNWDIKIMAKYDQYHSTFQHERNLDPSYDVQSLIKTETKEVTFHNNYSHAISLQVGVARSWDLSFAQLYLNAGIAPTYLIEVSGKTTFDTVVEKLIVDSDINDFSLSQNFEIGLLYPINSVVKIGLDYQYTHFFSDGIFVNHNIFANQQNTLVVNFTYRFLK